MSDESTGRSVETASHWAANSVAGDLVERYFSTDEKNRSRLRAMMFAKVPDEILEKVQEMMMRDGKFKECEKFIVERMKYERTQAPKPGQTASKSGGLDSFAT